MIKKSLFSLILISFLAVNSSADDSAIESGKLENRDLNLGWIGFLNLPKKINREDDLIKVKKPDLWEHWLKADGYEVDWFAKPKGQYKNNDKVFLLHIQPNASDNINQSRRDRRQNVK